MNPRVLVLCVASAFFPVAASADNAKLTPAKEADIRRLLEITGAAKLAKQIMSEMRTNIRPLVMKALPPGAYRERLVNLFFERFQSKMDAEKLVGLSVPLYDKYFTHEEIKGLVAFYETPLGHKSVEVLPGLMAEMAQRGREYGETAGRASLTEVLAEHPDLKAELEEAAKRAQDK